MDKFLEDLKTEKTHTPVATEVMAETAKAVNNLQQVVELLECKLFTVMRTKLESVDPTPEKNCREYPPLFSELAGYNTSINDSIRIIEDCIRRIEL